MNWKRALRGLTLIATLVFAFISIFSAIFPLTDWSALAGGVLAVFSQRRLGIAFIVAGVASVVLLANQLTGLHLQSILCHTPS